MKTILTLCILLIFTTNTLAVTVPEEAVRIAPAYIGFKETWGDNKGPEVNKVLKRVGLGPGYSWCMALAYTVFDDAAKNLKKPNPILKTAKCSDWWRYAMKRKLTYKIVTADQVLLGAKLKPGMTPIWQRGKITADGSFPGHVGILIDHEDTNTFVSLEGNTFILNDGGDQGEGDMSGYKRRKITKLGKFKLLGFVGVR